eukprot:11368318-Prorocentrum_lima.AAC.1
MSACAGVEEADNVCIATNTTPTTPLPANPVVPMPASTIPLIPGPPSACSPRRHALRGAPTARRCRI